MKKNTTKIFIAAVFLTISGTAFAQEGRVGINTSTPAATLDVVASPSNTTRIDGFIAPRLKGSELKAKDGLYTAAQDGTIVYVTEALSSSAGKTTNVTSIGYYYFDKTQSTEGRWMKIANPSAAAIYQEPWNIQESTTPSTSNNDAIYQTGNVAIGRTKGYTIDAKTVRLDVLGEIRTGAGHGGAIGINSVAMGLYNEASGNNSSAFGNTSKASGAQSFAGGSNSTASGDNSLAMGNNTKATAFASASFGELSEANSKYSLSAGYYNLTSNAGEAAVGVYNKTSTGALFTVGDGSGNGASNVTRRNIISAQKANDGSFVAIGSGTAEPSKVRDETLRVYGGALANKAYVTGINSEAGAATDKLVVADPNTGQLKTISATGASVSYQEPWNQAGTTTPATANNQAIYQKGAVSIWRDEVFESTDSSSAKVDLHVNGATRIGAIAQDPDVTKKVGKSSFAGGYKAVASGNNAMAYGASVEASGFNSAALGNSNVSSGSSSFTAGTSNIAGGISSVALGSDNKIDSNANFSIVGGLSNLIKNSSYSAVVLGTRNNIDQSANAMAAGTDNIIGSKARAYASIALGSGNSIDSDYSAAIGLENEIGSKASAKESIAQGSRNSIDSDYSVAIGVENEIGQYSNSSFALGQNARIAGTGTGDVNNAYNSYALGYKATVGYDSVDGTTVTGANSAYAIGSEALANGKYSYAIGYRAKAKAYGAIAIGSGINVSNQNNTAIGSYNIADLDASFAVGIGTDIDSRKNGLMVFNNGKAAIGSYSSAPFFNNGETLQVNGGALANKAYVKDINSVIGATTDKIVVADGTTGQLKTISATGSAVAYKEPWNIQNSSTPSASNNDAIYQTGNVAIGRTKGYTIDAKTVRLDVLGEIRTGAGHGGAIGINSVAMGLYNEASGNNSVAMGNSNTASGANSAAFGNTAEASGIESFAAGSTTKASGVRSFATGWKTEVTGENSAGFGYNNTISGVNSVAMGNGSTVKTNQSFAGGSGSTVTYSLDDTGDNSIAFGEVAQAVAASSAAFGKNTFASGEQSLVFGNHASTTGNYSLAGGNNTIALGIGSVAFGNGSQAQGNYSFAFGNTNVINTLAVGEHSFAFGLGVYSKFKHSVGIGAGASVPVRSGVVLGRYNAYTTGVYVDGRNDNNKPGDPIFQVGQGVSSSNRSNIITGFYGNGEDGSYRPGWVVIGSRTDLAPGSNYFDSPRLGTATLSVLGSFAAQGSITALGAVNANTSTFPDYVFEKYYTGTSNLNKDYQFNTLYETEKFIKEHKHLPGINSVSELEKTETGYSIDLGKTTTQTLEKVEELYLHTIEQQKQIDELKDIVKQQQKQIDQLLKK